MENCIFAESSFLFRYTRYLGAVRAPNLQFTIAPKYLRAGQMVVRDDKENSALGEEWERLALRAEGKTVKVQYTCTISLSTSSLSAYLYF